MRRSRSSKIIAGILLVVFIALLQPVNDNLYRDRLILGMRNPTPVTKIIEFDPTAITGVIAGAVLGGFRELAATMLWMKTKEMWNTGKGTYFDALNLMRTVTLLDPHWIEPWRITGWHLCYNLYVETEDPALRAELLRLGVNCLKEGISWNPDRYELYFELGWTLFDKVKAYKRASRWLEAATQFEHPEYIERLIAHGWERVPDMPRALDWYDFCIKRNPSDHTAHGATLTIRERYLYAWRLMEEEKYDAALDEIDYVLAEETFDTLGMHMKGHIYEEAGDLERALETWQIAAVNFSLDFYAMAKVAELSRELGRPVPGYASDIYKRRQQATDTGRELAVPKPQPQRF